MKKVNLSAMTSEAAEDSKIELIKSEIKAACDYHYTDGFDFENPSSNNNHVFEWLMDNLDDLIDSHDFDLLAAFDGELKAESRKKLNNWLKDKSILFLFEHDLVVERGHQFYQSRTKFMTHYVEEWEYELSGDLDFEALSAEEIYNLEIELNCYIPKGSNQVFYLLGTGFALELPKKAILREYKNYLRDRL